MFIQVPLSTGATLQAGLDSDHRAKDNSMVGVGVGVGGEGVLLHHTEEQGLGEKTQTNLGEESLYSDLPSFHVCGTQPIK